MTAATAVKQEREVANGNAEDEEIREKVLVGGGSAAAIIAHPFQRLYARRWLALTLCVEAVER